MKIVSVIEREAQQEELRRLHQVARERGYRPAWVGMRFRDRFGFWPRGLRVKRSVA